MTKPLRQVHPHMPGDVTSASVPRRIQMLHWTPAERAIYDAVQAVEQAGAHPLLTEAVTLLGRARAKVADYVDRDDPTQAHLVGYPRVSDEEVHRAICYFYGAEDFWPTEGDVERMRTLLMNGAAPPAAGEAGSQ